MELATILTLFLFFSSVFFQEIKAGSELKFGRFNEKCVYQNKDFLYACHDFNNLMYISLKDFNNTKIIKTPDVIFGLESIDGVSHNI